MTDKCKEIWESVDWENADSVRKAFERISQACPDCECEGCSASIFSQGTVTESKS